MLKFKIKFRRLKVKRTEIREAGTTTHTVIISEKNEELLRTFYLKNVAYTLKPFEVISVSLFMQIVKRQAET